MRKGSSMKNTVFKSILAVIIAICLPSMAYASCFPSVSLGTYNLGEWSNADRSWVISDTVGDFDDRVSTKAELLKQKNKLVESCETKGKALITKAKEYFTEKKNNLGTQYDATCGEGELCQQLRSAWIQQESNAIDEHVEDMEDWYTGNIATCKSNFEGVYNTLVDHLCT